MSERWFRLATDNGYLTVPFVAAIIWADPECSLTGKVTEENLARSYQWYAIAREHLQQSCFEKNGQALFHLGQMHELGLGGDRDLAKAAEYYRAAIRCGNRCRADLGRLFCTSEVEPVDALELCRCLAATPATGNEEVRDAYHEALATLTPAQRRRLSRIRGRRRAGA